MSEATTTRPRHLTRLPALANSRIVAVVATAGCWVSPTLRLGADPALPAYLYLAVIGVALAVAAPAGSRPGNLPRALLGGIALLAVYAGIRLVHPPG